MAVLSRTLIASLGAGAAAFAPANGGLRTSAQQQSLASQQPAAAAPSGATVPLASLAACGVAAAGLAAAGSRRRGAARSAVAVRAFESELGVQAPVGYWDPLGLSKDGDEAVFKRRRASELKHGRICMYATLGYIVPEYFRFPGYLSVSENIKFSDMPSGIEGMFATPIAGGLQIFAFMGFLEVGLLRQDGSRAPGDFEAVGNLGVPYAEGVENPEERKRKLNSELANGRLAMVAFMGMVFQNGTFGTTGPEMWLPGGAFEKELGVQAPLGYWDPLGYAADGDAEVFYRRRCTEIKHGRVAMWAAMGYIAPEFFRWPGYCSLSASQEFTTIPNGLKALGVVSGAGWAQMFLFAGFLELFAARQDPADPPGKLGGQESGFGKAYFGRLGIFKAKGIEDPEERARSLNAELANGRLAMMAIMGMMFQDGLTGSAWGDWANYTDSPLR